MVQAAARFQHHPLCRRHYLQLIQSHVAPSYGPLARVLCPLVFQAKSLQLPKTRGKRSILKLHNPNLHQSHVIPKRPAGPLHLGLNPSANLPPQPHFRLLPQSVTPASIPVFSQLYWAAIVSLGRCGPVAWSQSSPSFYAGAVPSYIIG